MNQDNDNIEQDGLTDENLSETENSEKPDEKEKVAEKQSLGAMHYLSRFGKAAWAYICITGKP